MGIYCARLSTGLSIMSICGKGLELAEWDLLRKGSPGSGSMGYVGMQRVVV